MRRVHWHEDGPPPDVVRAYRVSPDGSTAWDRTYVAVDALTSGRALEAAARKHADWEGFPDASDSIMEQAREIIEAAVAALSEEEN